MAYEKRDMSGAIFRNDKGDNDRRPDMKGWLKLGGVEYEVAGWTKHSERAGKYLSLKIQEPREQVAETINDLNREARQNEKSEEMPF